ncbi:MAG: serine-type D-Ala-D-Ala carboxypeptidase [Aliivibrio sp.]|uniref:serine-type D-Ala-D-Ala carboxypeptidase n=1 Tax=Aliivibrio sp. TaxID=1872443 RepID=UPI001A37A13D|nr:serine-type D-Ala-D-Ala carboxypeptidase [Aliivibrio sp.]
MTLRLAFSLFVMITSSVQASVDTALQQLPKGSRASLFVHSLSSGKTLLNHNSEQMIPPASTQKLVTALAAKLLLTDNYQFKTSLQRDGSDVVINFSGDPTLTEQNLSQLLQQAKQSGLHSIKGNLWLNDSVFTGYERGVGWPWDIMGIGYSAPSSAITLNQNAVMASIYTESNGKTRVHVPQHQSIEVNTSAISVSKSEKKSQFCDLELLTSPNNHYHLSGCLQQRSTPLPLKFAVQNTFLYSKHVVQRLLTDHNIQLEGDILQGVPTADFQPSESPLATHQSEPLSLLIKTMLKESNNLYADNITKTLGHIYYQQAGSFSNGTAAIKAILLQQANIDIELAVLADGSGLSRNNKMTAQQLSTVLSYIYRHNSELNLLDALPTSGVDGTLKYRASMRKAPILNAITAKSGSLFGSYNMAGFVNTKKGEILLFIQLIADYHPVKKLDNAPPVQSPIERFERDFYQSMINDTL